MVPTAGVEPAQVAPLAPQTSASTNFATSARIMHTHLIVKAPAPQAAGSLARLAATRALPVGSPRRPLPRARSRS